MLYISMENGMVRQESRSNNRYASWYATRILRTHKRQVEWWRRNGFVRLKYPIKSRVYTFIILKGRRGRNKLGRDRSREGRVIPLVVKFSFGPHGDYIGTGAATLFTRLDIDINSYR